MADTNENMDHLLDVFFPAAQAHQAAEDIRNGDRLMRQYSAPQPDAAVLADVNAKVAAALFARGRRQAIHWAGRTVAAVAAVIVIGGMLLFFSGDDGDTSIRHIAMPVGPDWWDDSAVETLSAEVDDVIETMISISVDDTFVEDRMSEFDETELEELEAIAMNDDFWKG